MEEGSNGGSLKATKVALATEKAPEPTPTAASPLTQIPTSAAVQTPDAVLSPARSLPPGEVLARPPCSSHPRPGQTSASSTQAPSDVGVRSPTPQPAAAEVSATGATGAETLRPTKADSSNQTSPQKCRESLPPMTLSSRNGSEPVRSATSLVELFRTESSQTVPCGPGPKETFTHFALVTEWKGALITEGALLGWKEGLNFWCNLTTVPKEFCGGGSATLHEGCIVLRGRSTTTMKRFHLATRRWEQDRTVPMVKPFTATAVVSGHLMNFGGGTIDILSSSENSVPAETVCKLSSLSCSVAVNGTKVIILLRCLAYPDGTDPLHVMLYDHTCGRVTRAPCSPLLEVDMARLMSTPKYIGFLGDTHCFLCGDGNVLRFSVKDNSVLTHDSWHVKGMEMRRHFGTFLEGFELSIIGGRDEGQSQKMYRCDPIQTDFCSQKQCRFPAFAYDTDVWQTFYVPR